MPATGRINTVLLATLLLWPFCSFGQEAGQGAEKARAIRKVRVEDRRLSDIGVTKTVLDTVALRDDVTSSLADVLAGNTSIFVKSSGRGSLATASLRGTSPSHTQVTWNGVRLNSPMLGMVDLSTIPAYLVDEAAVFYGAGSVGIAGGGLGGAIALGTKAPDGKGLGIGFVQGISSFCTWDDFLGLTWAGGKFKSSTRLYYTKSENDFPYRNYEKDGYPTERNRNGRFRDLHVLQELYFAPDSRNRFSLAAWYVDSNRGLPAINARYGKDNSRSDQAERTFRGVMGWDRIGRKWSVGAKAGYIYTDMGFRSVQAGAEGIFGVTLDSRNFVHTGFAKALSSYYPSPNFELSASVEANVHYVDNSQHDNNITTGYKHDRAEISALVTAKYRPHPRIGLGLDLREEGYGGVWTPLIPAAFADYKLWPKYNVTARVSGSRNYRYPTFNDLYFKPGGNPGLDVEKGYTVDGGISFDARNRKDNFGIGGGATVYNSNIRDWILWLPDHRGFWSPVNVKRVHNYGIELRCKADARLGRGWALSLSADWALTKSINMGDPRSWSDESIGKQLVYVPEYSASAVGRLAWRKYAFTYKYGYYSERFTTSDNQKEGGLYRLYTVEPYHMSDIALERTIGWRYAGISLKLTINNLFDESYVTVMSRPMPGRNYGFFIGIRPRTGSSASRRPNNGPAPPPPQKPTGHNPLHISSVHLEMHGWHCICITSKCLSDDSLSINLNNLRL